LYVYGNPSGPSIVYPVDVKTGSSIGAFVCACPSPTLEVQIPAPQLFVVGTYEVVSGEFEI